MSGLNCSWPGALMHMMLEKPDDSGIIPILPPTGSRSNPAPDPLTISYSNNSYGPAVVNSAVTPIAPPTISGGVGPYTLSIFPDINPYGLNFNPGTGAISGVATQKCTVAGNCSYTVTVTDSEGSSATADISIIINDAPPTTINYDQDADKDGILDNTFNPNQAAALSGVATTDGTGVISYSATALRGGGGSDLSGAPLNISQLSDIGLAIDSASGEISGTPNTSGQFEVTVEADNSASGGGTTSRTFTFTVNPPELTITDGSGDEATQVGLSATLSNRSIDDVTFNWSTGDSSARAIDGDFTAATNSPVTIPAGSLDSGGDITVDLLDDGVAAEGDETFDIILSSPVSATFLDNIGAVTIFDINVLPPTFEFGAATQTVNENDGAITITLSSSSTAVFSATVDYTLSDGSATGGAGSTGDYQNDVTQALVNFSGGSGTFTININDDLLAESAENFTITLLDNGGSGAGTYDLGAQNNTTITINDNEVVAIKAETMDADGNGQIDHYRLEFLVEMEDATFPGYQGDGVAGNIQFDWLIAGYSEVQFVNGAAAPEADSINDRIIYLKFKESGTHDSGTVPDLTTSTTPGFTSTVATGSLNAAEHFTATVTEADRAAPRIIGASSATGNSSVSIQFSEPVRSSSGAGCIAPIDVASGLSYNDDPAISGGGNITALNTTGPDLDGCDSVIEVDVVGGTFNENDLYNDEVLPLAATPGSLYDLSGNPALTTAVKITGTIRPYVLTVVSLSTYKLRIVYSEPMVSDGGANSANLLSNYSYTALSGNGCNTAGALSDPGSSITTVSPTTFEITLAAAYPQQSLCTYELSVTGDVRDQDENAAMIAPLSGSFIGNEAIKVIGAEATALNEFIITFSKDVFDSAAPGGAQNLSYYTIPEALGSVTGATVVAGAPHQVRITHSLDQGVGVYTVVVDTALQDATQTDNLQGNPRDRANFVGFGGNIERLEDGALFEDPFADGSSFAFAFEYGGKIYLGPNDTNEGIFRFDPDGSNATLVTFSIDSALAGAPFSSFGANLTRPARSVTATNDGVDTTYRYYLPTDTNLINFGPGDTVTVTGCTDNLYNRTGAATVVDDGADYIELVVPGTTNSGSAANESCQLLVYNSAGPANFSGIDAFVKATVGGTEYLVFGAHKEGGGGFSELYFTTDVDNHLNINYCDISGVTLGNTSSLQPIYGWGNYLFIGFASTNNAPGFAYMDLTLNGQECNNLSQMGTGNNRFKNVDYLGMSGTPGNNATNVGIDSFAGYQNNLYVANNGGIAFTSAAPPTSSNQFMADNASGDIIVCDLIDGGICNTAWSTGGVTQAIPGLGQMRPGEKGIPFMVEFGGSGSNLLYIARNRADGTAELWSYDGASLSPAPLLQTGSSVTGGTVAGHDISMLIVNGDYLYIGFDNEATGSEVYRSLDGSNWEKVGVDGLGPQSADATARSYNKYIISSTSAFYNGSSYLYVTTGCNRTDWMFDDDGSSAPAACDRNTATGATDFSIKVFRQVD